MSRILGEAIATWAKTGVQNLVEKVFNSPIFEADDDEAVCLEGFPRTVQLDNYSCGVQVLRSVLAYYERNVPSFYAHWDWEDTDGIDTPIIKEVLKEFDLKGRETDGWDAVERAINKDRPVIVCLDDSGHWSVVFGYSPSHVYLMDPSPRRLVGHRIDWEEFEERWDGWGLEVREG